jgi:hypothetical protein
MFLISELITRTLLDNNLQSAYRGPTSTSFGTRHKYIVGRGTGAVRAARDDVATSEVRKGELKPSASVICIHIVVRTDVD